MPHNEGIPTIHLGDASCCTTSIFTALDAQQWNSISSFFWLQAPFSLEREDNPFFESPRDISIEFNRFDCQQKRRNGPRSYFQLIWLVHWLHRLPPLLPYKGNNYAEVSKSFANHLLESTLSLSKDFLTRNLHLTPAGQEPLQGSSWRDDVMTWKQRKENTIHNIFHVFGSPSDIKFSLHTI